MVIGNNLQGIALAAADHEMMQVWRLLPQQSL